MYIARSVTGSTWRLPPRTGGSSVRSQIEEIGRARSGSLCFLRMFWWVLRLSGFMGLSRSRTRATLSGPSAPGSWMSFAVP
eukprot:3027671-Alexandrium_andersonii.AAC.1